MILRIIISTLLFSPLTVLAVDDTTAGANVFETTGGAHRIWLMTSSDNTDYDGIAMHGDRWIELEGGNTVGSFTVYKGAASSNPYIPSNLSATVDTTDIPVTGCHDYCATVNGSSFWVEFGIIFDTEDKVSELYPNLQPKCLHIYKCGPSGCQ